MPFLAEELLKRALIFASKYANISEEEKHIIMHTKKSTLYNNKIPWNKRGESDFDVAMESFDGAETCDLIGLYMLSQLKHLDINVGLYRDDGLAICRKTPRQTELIKKEMQAIFNRNNLKITIDANKKSVDFLDITLNLTTETYKPFMKQNNTPLYVHRDSNHPPSILRNLPESINKRISNISSNEDIFNEAIPPYQEALNKSGYNYQLKFNQQSSQSEVKNTRKRSRKITWFNPPYSENVATNIGRNFFKLIDKCFPPGHQLNKLLNRNTVKLSYSCMQNVKSIISMHNRSKANKSEPTQIDKDQTLCNCQSSRQCPLEKKCLTKGIVYQATVTRQDNLKMETYIGLTENSFKSRYTGHVSSFKDQKRRNATALSEYIWKLKEKNVQYSIKWKIVSKAKSYSTSSKLCNLCTEEKFFIIHRPEMSSLNKRNELISACRHRKKHLLSSYK